jgi:hypothetical protein
MFLMVILQWANFRAEPPMNIHSDAFDVSLLADMSATEGG